MFCKWSFLVFNDFKVGPAAYASARPAQAQTEPEKIPIDSISVKLW